MRRDYYEVIGVRRDADDKEVKKAFRKEGIDITFDAAGKNPAATSGAGAQ